MICGRSGGHKPLRRFIAFIVFSRSQNDPPNIPARAELSLGSYWPPGRREVVIRTARDKTLELETGGSEVPTATNTIKHGIATVTANASVS